MPSSAAAIPDDVTGELIERPSRHEGNIPENISGDGNLQAHASCDAGEYHIGYEPELAAYSSVNRAQNLQVRYAADGFSLAPRRGGTAGWRLDLRLERIGRGGRELRTKPVGNPATSPRVRVSGERMSVQHDGFRIDYTNTGDGMRQDFIVEQRLEGSGPLQVELHAGGDLRPVVQREDDLLFVAGEPATPVVWYRGLKAWDADGRELAAHMEAAGERIALVVDDAGARYPVTVDPVSATPSSFIPAMPGYPAIVQSAEVRGAGDLNGDGFDEVMIGTYEYTNGEYNEGLVRIYYGSPSGIDTARPWVVESNDAGRYFGGSIAAAGDLNGDGYDDIAIGGSPSHRPGRVFVYYGSPTGPGTVADWIADGTSAGDRFGRSIAGAGDVNGDGYDDLIVGGTGREAVVYHGSASGLSRVPAWRGTPGTTIESYLQVSGAGDINGDGYDDVIIGGYSYLTGKVFVYYGSATGLGALPLWTGLGYGAGSSFGHVASKAGDVNGDGFGDVIISDPNYRAPGSGSPGRGRIYAYHGSPAGIASVPDWILDGQQTQQTSVGESVSGAGDFNNDGFDDILLRTSEGIIVHYGSSDGLAPVAGWSGESLPLIKGYEAGGGADVNGDGFSDAVVAARYYFGGNDGYALIYHGGPDAGTGGVFSGVVVDSLENPVAGARVTVDDDRIVTTDSAGMFRFPVQVPLGLHRVMVTARGLAAAELDLVMEDADKHVVIGLVPAFYTVCGTVAERYGNGPLLPDVTVEILRSGNVLSAVQTDSRGRFCSPGYLLGSYQIRFSKAGYRTVTMDLTLEEDKHIVMSLVLSQLQ